MCSVQTPHDSFRFCVVVRLNLIVCDSVSSKFCSWCATCWVGVLRVVCEWCAAVSMTKPMNPYLLCVRFLGR